MYIISLQVLSGIVKHYDDDQASSAKVVTIAVRMILLAGSSGNPSFYSFPILTLDPLSSETSIFGVSEHSDACQGFKQNIRR